LIKELFKLAESNITSSAEPGIPAPPAPPEEDAQLDAFTHLPLLAPTQYNVAAEIKLTEIIIKIKIIKNN